MAIAEKTSRRSAKLSFGEVSVITKNFQVNFGDYGEMAEWLKAHAWKACIVNPIGGSNPPLSVQLVERRP